MRCRICNSPHKNIGSKRNWIEFQLCRVCSQLIEYFSFNSNYLKEYWVDEIT